MKISFTDSNPSEKRIVDYLKNVKQESGEEIKTQIFKAMTALYDVYAIGSNPNSTKADLERAMLRCWNALSTHLSEVALYGKNHHHNVSLWYPQFDLVDSLALTHVPAVTHKDRPDLNQTATIVEAKQEIEVIEEHKDEDDEDDDEDPFQGMTDEEYLVMMNDRIIDTIIKD